MSIKVNPNYLYTKTHEWVIMDKDGKTASVGVSDYAQSALGDVVYVSEAEVGKNIKQGEQIATIDSVKVSAELYAPISGKIIAFNKKLSNSPELVNNDPHGEGWMVQIEITDKAEMADLLSPEEYHNMLSAAH